MKKIFSILFVLSVFCLAQAQTFIGSMTVGTYKRENVEVKLIAKNNTATLFLYDVKFSRFMPVKVDVSIANLKLIKQNNKTTISGNNITSTVKGKGYDKYKVTDFSGTVTKEGLVFSTFMGDKKVNYKGKLK